MNEALTGEACLYALRLREKGFTEVELARFTGRTVREIKEALARADELERETDGG